LAGQGAGPVIGGTAHFLEVIGRGVLARGASHSAEVGAVGHVVAGAAVPARDRHIPHFFFFSHNVLRETPSLSAISCNSIVWPKRFSVSRMCSSSDRIPSAAAGRGFGRGKSAASRTSRLLMTA